MLAQLPRRSFLPLALSLLPVLALPARAHDEAEIVFNRDVRPILSDNCFRCHGPDAAARKAKLRLDQRESVLALEVVVPGEPDASELIDRITSSDPRRVMPPPRTQRKLTDAQKDVLRRWVSAGAPYQPHWSFIPVPAK